MPPRSQRSKAEVEKAMALAIEDVEIRGLSYRDAAEQRGVAYKTLWGRVHGRKERQKAHENEQALNGDEEREVVAWALLMDRRLLPVRLVHLVGCAEAIWNNKNGTVGRTLGVHWAQRFLARHPELKVTTSKRISETRVMARNPEKIQEFYDLLRDTREEFKVTRGRTFNMDEKGWQLGVSSRESVIILTRDHRDGYAGGSKHSGNRETITTCDTICDEGYPLAPMVIMKGKHVLSSWMQNSPLPKETLWACSPTGWTNQELGVQYIKHFDRLTADKAARGEYRLLILDGHGSHLTYEFLHYAQLARIIVLGLPSHTTDFLQPLDRVIFRSLQRFYGQAVSEYAQKGLAVTKKNFSKLLHQARKQAYTKKNILSAFEATGIEPFDPYRTPIMKDYQARMHSQEKPIDLTQPAAPQSPRSRRIAITSDSKQLLDNPEASVESLRRALEGVLGVVDGSEARALIAENRMSEMQESAKEKQKATRRGGKIGHAKVYTQEDALEEIRLKEESRAQAASGGKRGLKDSYIEFKENRAWCLFQRAL